jgi:chorismate mutase
MSTALAQLRSEIDRIDSDMHRLLVERGEVVGRVQEAKRLAGDTGSAFRPAREAELMRNMIARDHGRWPVDTPENIWRVILATSTWCQVPYAVHADLSGSEQEMRESMRFHFGFTVPLRAARDAADVIRAVGQAIGDLGMFRIAQSPGLGAWWSGLTELGAPKIIARLPFVKRASHPADLPCYVIAKPQNEGFARETIVASLHVSRWSRQAAEALTNAGGALVASAGNAQGGILLIAHEASLEAERLIDALLAARCGPSRYVEVGCHARHLPLNIAQPG